MTVALYDPVINKPSSLACSNFTSHSMRLIRTGGSNDGITYSGNLCVRHCVRPLLAHNVYGNVHSHTCTDTQTHKHTCRQPSGRHKFVLSFDACAASPGKSSCPPLSHLALSTVAATAVLLLFSPYICPASVFCGATARRQRAAPGELSAGVCQYLC